MPKRSDTSYHKRMLASRMENPEFRAEYDRVMAAEGRTAVYVTPERIYSNS